VNVVVEARLELEASGLPKLSYLGSSVVIVKHELGQVTNQEETGGVGLTSSVESTAEIALMFRVTFKMQHFLKAVVAVLVGKSAVRKGAHSVHAGTYGIKRHRKGDTSGNTTSSARKSINPAGTEEEVRVFLDPVVNIGHRSHQGTEFETIGETTSKENTFVNCFAESLN
jgi:hypothetical protein